MKTLKLQSAMEYLMTYGWAILIIAVVLGALFGLGFFNAANLAPKVGPGACQVYRPNGPVTTSFINLEGTCNNELPQYVGQFSGSHPGPINVSSPSFASLSNGFTLTAWVSGSVSQGGTIFATNCFKIIDNINSQGYNIGLSALGGGCGSAGWSTPFFGSPNTFSFITITASSSPCKGYGNGALVFTCGGVYTVSNMITGANVGATYFSGLSGTYTGYLADVQLYNASLSANEILALYQEGIGGVPVLPQKLVGWWPLNGNANDYSGNLNNGIPSNVIFTGSWTSGYTAP